MKVIAINGSPRKKWNTATLLTKALEGAASAGAETEFIHLNDLQFSGCQSCFSCKEKGGKSYGKCIRRDELAPILDKIGGIDAIILGSPVYIGSHSGLMRNFLERLMFPYTTYSKTAQTLFPKKINTGFIYTMNVTEARLKERGYGRGFIFIEELLIRIFGASETLYSFDTYQFKDYSKVVADNYDPQEKARRRQEVFPKDCQSAFEMGVKFGQNIFIQEEH